VDAEHLNGAVRHLGDLGVRSLISRPPTLEQLFLRYYSDEPADEHDPARRGP
jgi:ABC-2 type transport system ATP-binding protein